MDLFVFVVASSIHGNEIPQGLPYGTAFCTCSQTTVQVSDRFVLGYNKIDIELQNVVR